MVSFCIQAIFFLLIVLFQVSFLNVVFSDTFVNALLAITIALILSRGFFHSWPWIIYIGLLFDILASGSIGISPIILILFAYGISFLSRRFLVEHKTSGTVLAVFFMIITSILYFPSMALLKHVILNTPLSWNTLMMYASNIHPVSGSFLNALLFILLYGVILRIDEALNFYGDRVVVQR